MAKLDAAELERAAVELAERLSETEPHPRAQIAAVIKRWGLRFAEKLASHAEERHALGNFVAWNGRPRTLGGTFFALVKSRMKRCDREGVLSIFGPAPHPLRKAAPLSATVVPGATDAPAQPGEASREASSPPVASPSPTKPSLVRATLAKASVQTGPVTSKPVAAAKPANKQPDVARPATKGPSALTKPRLNGRRALPASSTYFDPEFMRR